MTCMGAVGRISPHWLCLIHIHRLLLNTAILVGPEASLPVPLLLTGYPRQPQGLGVDTSGHHIPRQSSVWLKQIAYILHGSIFGFLLVLFFSVGLFQTISIVFFVFPSPSDSSVATVSNHFSYDVYCCCPARVLVTQCYSWTKPSPFCI